MCQSHSSTFHLTFCFRSINAEKKVRFKTRFCRIIAGNYVVEVEWDQNEWLQWSPLMPGTQLNSECRCSVNSSIIYNDVCIRDENKSLMLGGQQGPLASWLIFRVFESMISVRWCIKSYASYGRSFLSCFRIRHWQKKKHLLFVKAIVDFAYKVISWGKRKQLAGDGIQHLFIFLRLLGKHKGVLRVGKMFPEQRNGRSSPPPNTYNGRSFSICSGAPQCASQESGYWQSGMEMDHSVSAKSLGY